jgi:hypothetical protein
VKGDSQRIDILWKILNGPGSNDPEKALFYHKKLLQLTRKQNDKVGEAIVTIAIGYSLGVTGNTAKGTEMLFNALRMAEETHSKWAIGSAYWGLAVFYTDPATKKRYLQKAAEYLGPNDIYLFDTYAQFSNLYAAEGKSDSALYFAQKALDLVTTRKSELLMTPALVFVGEANYLQGRKALALEYYRAAQQTPFFLKEGRVQEKMSVYGAFAGYFLSEGKQDSALYYTKLLDETTKDSYFAFRLSPAYLFWKIYEKTNSDSALKYATQYYAMKDSVYSIDKMQQMQALEILENDRQERLNEERTHNLQYAAIALGMLALLIGFLVLSHSALANQRLIRFLGVVSLLIVFEFLNLLLHPWLGAVTHHSPILMLLAMVCVAALLVPLHHKIEHWVIHHMVEKNNRIRLAAAKRTIQQLEGEVGTMVVNKGSGAEKPH